MVVRLRHMGALAVFASATLAQPALADGIVSKIVNSPLSAAGLVRGAHSGINVYLQSAAAPGMEFMDPNVIGYVVPAGGRVEIEMGEGFERIANLSLTQKTIMVVTGAPQQGMPGARVGYKVGEGDKPGIITLTPTKPEGLKAASLMSPAPGAKGDPVRQRGIKVFHVGLLQSAFINRGRSGTIHVRILDGSGKVIHGGKASVDFIDAPVPQIQPNNFPDRSRNHNWQTVKVGGTLGKSPGTLPIPVMYFDADKSVAPSRLVKFKKGLIGVGVLSARQLAKMKFERPAAIARYNGGLIVQDSDGDGRLDPKSDRILGGVIGKAPAGAKGHELKSLVVHGAADLSKPSAAYHARFGKFFQGAVGLLQFTAGDKPGLYRPTVALLREPGNLASGDGASYTFTIIAKP